MYILTAISDHTHVSTYTRKALRLTSNPHLTRIQRASDAQLTRLGRRGGAVPSDQMLKASQANAAAAETSATAAAAATAASQVWASVFKMWLERGVVRGVIQAWPELV